MFDHQPDAQDLLMIEKTIHSSVAVFVMNGNLPDSYMREAEQLALPSFHTRFLYALIAKM